MALKAKPLEQIDGTKDMLKIAVRIEHLWSAKKTLEMVFLDEKGEKIHAIVLPSLDVNKWKDTLQEGKTYIIQNFEVHNNDGDYRKTRHPFKLLFSKTTIVQEKDMPAIPEYVYQFTKFEDIIGGHADPNVLVDIIGEFAEFVPNESDSGPKRVVCCLRDQSNNRLNCTLWGEYGSRMESFVNNHQTETIVVLLTLAKIKNSKGYPISIQNSWHSSKLYINDDIKEIQEYKSSLGTDVSRVYRESSFTQTLSQLSSCSQIQSEEKFFLNAQIKSLAAINSLKQEAWCVTVMKVDKVCVNNGWSYISCSKCKKGGQAVPYVCQGCNKRITETILRFKVEIKVSHGGESAKMVLWDQQSEKLLKHTAVELKNLLIADGETNDMAFPQVLNDLEGRTVAFKIKVQPTSNRCSVIDVSEDVETINTILKKIQNDEDIMSVEKRNSISCVGKEDDLINSQSLSVTADFADFDPDSLESLTPGKRLSSQIQIDASQDPNSCEFSSTKLTKHIKTE